MGDIGNRGVQVQWLGAAGFRISFKNTVLLIDPYLTRNPYAAPLPPELTLEKLADSAEHVLVSHGHFDHITDIPALLSHNPIMRLHGPETALRTIRRYGGQGTSLNQGRIKISDDVSADALLSQHVRFDIPLAVKTGFRTMFSKASWGHARPRLLKDYPCGEMVSYVLNFRENGNSAFRVLYLGSAGPTDEMLDSWIRVHRKMDCLLVPVQGNSKICEIAANIVARVKPRFVIPHHHDDFFPPISQHIDLEPFKRLVAERAPESAVFDLELGGTHVFDLVTSPELRGKNENAALSVS